MLNADTIATLRARAKPAPRAPAVYQRTLAGFLLHHGEPIHLRLVGYGVFNGSIILTAATELVDDGTGVSGSVVVIDANLGAADRTPITFSLKTGQLIGEPRMNSMVLGDFRSGRAGYTVHPDDMLLLSRMAPSAAAPVTENVTASRRTAILTKAPHETQEQYEARVTRNGFKVPATLEQIEAREASWRDRMRVNANDGTLGTEKPGAPHLQPQPPARDPRPTDEEITSQHKRRAFSAGKENKRVERG